MRKKWIVIFLFFLAPPPSRADLFGGDLPLLAQIVFNTLHTMMELSEQSRLMRDEMEGVRDRIYRLQTIADVVQPSSWEQWRNPAEALRRLKLIYHTLPREYRSEKADIIEEELSKAMNLISRLGPEANKTFLSGKELETRGVSASPGVAQKLTASGVGTLISLEAQSQVIQSHVVSLLSQMLADANEKESRTVISKGTSFSGFSENLGKHDGLFSTHVVPMTMRRFQ